MENMEQTKQITKEEIQNWKNIVQKDVEQVGAKYNLNKLNLKFVAKKYQIMLGLLFFLGGVLLIAGVFIQFIGAPIISYLLIFLGAAVLIAAFILGALQYRIIRIEKNIIASLNVKHYYELALSQLTNNEYSLESIKKEFDLKPYNFLPTDGQSQIDNVMNIVGKNTKLSFGTITNEVIYRTVDAKGHEHVERVYHRYRYLNAILLKESELVATIQKSASFLKVFKTKDNTDLESTEFEKIFAVVANDQILIRKLLVPKVLANLVDKANNEKKIPAIEFNKQNLTLFLDRFLVKGWLDPKGSIATVDFFNNNNNLADTLCQDIIGDINSFLNCLSWLETYEVV